MELVKAIIIITTCIFVVSGMIVTIAGWCSIEKEIDPHGEKTICDKNKNPCFYCKYNATTNDSKACIYCNDNNLNREYYVKDK